MKIKYIILLLLLPITSLHAQEKKMYFGLDMNPMKVLEGHYELVGLTNWSKRIKTKISLGGTYANTNLLLHKRGRCLLLDFVDDRIEKGLFGKFSIDAAVISLPRIDVYIGSGLFYTKFTTRGKHSVSQEELSDSGDIFALGMTLGTRLKKIDPFIIDVGMQIYNYEKDRHQVGGLCKGTIPGIGEPGSGKVMLTFHAHVLLARYK
ncbi:MAG: hypothetical protein AB8F74_21240 [Saprospiraceae bacterium]